MGDRERGPLMQPDLLECLATLDSIADALNYYLSICLVYLSVRLISVMYSPYILVCVARESPSGTFLLNSSSFFLAHAS